MAGTRSSTSLGLEDARRRIARWRETRAYRGAPMPAALWAAAMRLARQHGLYTTARALHIDYGSLKKRLDAVSAGQGAVPAFVELPTAPLPGLGACVIELEARRDRRMRIEVSRVTLADLIALTQVAWGHAR